MEKNRPVTVRKVENGFIVTEFARDLNTYANGELVFETIEKLNAFLIEHYKD